MIGTNLEVIQRVNGTFTSGNFWASHQPIGRPIIYAVRLDLAVNLPKTTNQECRKRKKSKRCRCRNDVDSTDLKSVGFMCIIEERMPCVTSSTLSKGSLALRIAARISGATPKVGLGLISAATHIARSPGNAADGIGPRSRYSLRSWSGFRSYPLSYTYSSGFYVSNWI